FEGGNVFGPRLKPQSSPSLKQQLQRIVFQAIFNTKFYECSVVDADPTKNFLNDSIFIILRINFEPVWLKPFPVCIPFTRELTLKILLLGYPIRTPNHRTYSLQLF